MEAVNIEDRKYSVEEYVALMQRSDLKLEYHDGTIIPYGGGATAMAGATANHNRIQRDFGTILSYAKKDCIDFGSDQAVWIPALNKYVYPDISFVCGEADDYEDEDEYFLRNPTLIVEVLSKSTASRDRGKKFSWYRTLPSFREYILLDSQLVQADAYYLHDDGHWSIQNRYELDHVLHVHTLDIDVPLAEIYRRFKPTE